MKSKLQSPSLLLTSTDLYTEKIRDCKRMFLYGLDVQLFPM